MFRILILSSCYITIITSVDINPRIHEGYPANDGEFPYMAGIIYNNLLLCGGSIISEKYILTAAHCLRKYKGLPDVYSVNVGSIYWKESGFRHNVTKVISHADFKFKENENQTLLEVYNDIGLLVVNPLIKYSDNVRSINIQTKNVEIGVKATMSGWGRTEKNIGSLYLKYDKYTVEDMSKCNKDISALHNDNQYLCILSPKGTGSDRGDSGGPFVYKNNIIGIFSFGSIDRYSLYVNVSYYATWIKENIRN